MTVSMNDLRLLHDKVGTDPATALRMLRDYDRTFPQDQDLLRTRGGILIDIGAALLTEELVEEGISVLQSQPERAHPMYCYNLANGFSTLDLVARQKSDFVFDPIKSPLLDAKELYRKAYADIAKLDAPERARLRINFGNCLASLGRTLDAIDEYKIALRDVPNQPMAWGNLGVEEVRLSRVVRNWVLQLDARDCLDKALEGDALEAIGEGHARQYFSAVRQRLAQSFENVDTDPRNEKTPPHRYRTKRLQQYAEFCLRHGLFLSLALFDHHFSSVASDGLGFTLTTPVDDTTTFTYLSRTLNEIKEQYATARLLLFEAGHPAYRLLEYDEMTNYTDNLDYGVYGLSVGRYKSAFRGAYDVLDRIAFFVYVYLKVNPDDLKEHQVDFQSIWWTGRGTTSQPRQEVVNSKSYHLFALLDMARDMRKGGYFQRFWEIRNLLAHRYLIPHNEGVSWDSETDGAHYHISARDLESQTISLMHFVRNAAIHLIAFVHETEQEKRSKSSSLIVPIYVPQYKHFDW